MDNEIQSWDIEIRSVRLVSLQDELWFGKHEGYSVEDVIGVNPEYLLWAHEHDVIELDVNAYDAVMNAIDGYDEYGAIDFGVPPRRDFTDG